MIRLLVIGLFLFFLLGENAPALPPDDDQRAAWQRLQRLPLTETTFRQACDRLQEIARTNPQLGFDLLTDYTRRVHGTGNRAWLHVLLMGHARAKSSMIFSNQADSLYREARRNAGPGTRAYREALVGTVLLYGEWDKRDSLEKYLALGEADARRADDRENLSFLRTFRAATHPRDTAAMRRLFAEAIRLAAPLTDKNALFTARYNYANVYLQPDPKRQVAEFESLLELANDSSLNRYPRRLYDRTAFTFRNARPSVYYQLMQLNLLLTDYENAGNFAQLFYDATVTPNPQSLQAGYFNAEMAIVKAYQGRYDEARNYLSLSRAIFGVPDPDVPYIGYHVAAGLLAEHARRYDTALSHFRVAEGKGTSFGLYLMPPALYAAHVRTITRRFGDAERVLATFRPEAESRRYTAVGLYYHLYLAELLKAKGDFPAYAHALEAAYEIKDSLTNLNRYRAIQQVMAKVRLRDKEQQISRMRAEEAAREAQLRRERTFYLALLGLAVLAVVFLALYLRNRQIRHRQREALHASELESLEKQRRLDLLRGVMGAGETERRKIADQLHDEVNGLLALASLNVSSALENGVGDGQAEKKLVKTHDILTTVSSTVRAISHRLTPLALERYGFRQAVEELAESVNVAGKVRVETVVVGFDQPGSPAALLHNDLYRITQELLQNVLKHARATSARLEIIEHDDRVTLIVEDDGVGISETETPDGQGLATIRSRVAYLNGHLEISRKPEGGTMVVVEVPLSVSSFQSSVFS